MSSTEWVCLLDDRVVGSVHRFSSYISVDALGIVVASSPTLTLAQRSFDMPRSPLRSRRSDDASHRHDAFLFQVTLAATLGAGAAGLALAVALLHP